MVGKQFGLWTVVKLCRGGKKRQSWLCRCACGSERVLTTYNLSRNHIKSCGCARPRFGDKNQNWKGGRHLTTEGYVSLTRPVGFLGKLSAAGKVREHVFVMTQHLGRALYPGETVHHKNGVRHENNIDNLELWNKPQPTGCRVTDQVVWAKEILRRYAIS